MTEIIFNRRYIETLYSANYFGSTTDYSEEEIERKKERWIEEMKLLGWNLGDTILLTLIDERNITISYVI